MRTIPVATAAQIVGETEQLFRTLRHVYPKLRKLGERQGKHVELELSEVALFGLISRLARQSRTLRQSVAAAFVWQRVLDLVFTGQADHPDEPQYAIEARMPDGNLVRYHVAGGEGLQEAMAATVDAAAVQIFNLSLLAEEIQVGWLIAHDGRDAARKSLEQDLDRAGVSPEAREAQLVRFDRIAARLKPTASTRGRSFDDDEPEVEPQPLPSAPEARVPA